MSTSTSLSSIPPEVWKPRNLSSWSFHSLNLPIRHFQTDDILIRTGEYGPAYIILQGSAKVKCELVSQFVDVTTIGPGAFIGELELVSNSPCRSDVIALSPLTAYVLSSSSLQEVLSELHPDVGVLLTRTSDAFSSVFFDFLPALRSKNVVPESLSNSPSDSSLPAITEQFSPASSVNHKPGFISFDSCSTVAAAPTQPDFITSWFPQLNVLRDLDLGSLVSLTYTSAPLCPWIKELIGRCFERVCGTFEALAIREEESDGDEEFSDDSTTQSFLSDSDEESDFSDDGSDTSICSFESEIFDSSSFFLESSLPSTKPIVLEDQSTKLRDKSDRRDSVSSLGHPNDVPRCYTSPLLSVDNPNNVPYAAALTMGGYEPLSPAQSESSNISDDFEEDVSPLRRLIPSSSQSKLCQSVSASYTPVLARSTSLPGIVGDSTVYATGSPPATTFSFSHRSADDRLNQNFSWLDADRPKVFRLTCIGSRKVEKMFKKDEANLSWNFDYWKKGSENKTSISLYLCSLFTGFVDFLNDLDDFRVIITSDAIKNFVDLIIDYYTPSNAFHNISHAIGVTSSMVFLLRCRPLASCLSPLERLGLVISCLCHDLDHPGVNACLDKTLRPDLYSTLVDKSRRKSISEVSLEDLHYRHTLTILDQSKLLEFLTLENKTILLKTVKHCIMATDLAQHFSILQSAQGYGRNLTKPWRTNSLAYRKVLMKLLIKLVDLDNQSKSPKLAAEAALRVSYELFLQGKKEKELKISVPASRDEDKSTVLQVQLQFINFFVEPLVLLLVKVFPFFKPMQTYLDANKAMYTSLEDQLGRTPETAGLKAFYVWYKKKYNMEIEFFENNL
ncbi:hypothetical protein GEMRC1_004507 [Eukaryota sp. GEM-RC1]